MARWTALAVLLLISGCQTMSPAERRAADMETCRNYGFKRNNDALAECMMRLDLDRRQARRENAARRDDWDRDLWRRRYVW